MSKPKIKTIKVYTGTDIPMTTPSHPVSVVLQLKRIVDRISASSDSEYEYSCNSIEGIKMFERYGRGVHGLNVIYFINGKISKFDEVISDMSRATLLIDETINNATK